MKKEAMEVNTTRKVIEVGHSISQKQSVASPTIFCVNSKEEIYAYRLTSGSGTRHADDAGGHGLGAR
jgi:hypothetical protein